MIQNTSQIDPAVLDTLTMTGSSASTGYQGDGANGYGEEECSPLTRTLLITSLALKDRATTATSSSSSSSTRSTSLLNTGEISRIVSSPTVVKSKEPSITDTASVTRSVCSIDCFTTTGGCQGDCAKGGEEPSSLTATRIIKPLVLTARATTVTSVNSKESSTTQTTLAIRVRTRSIRNMSSFTTTGSCQSDSPNGDGESSPLTATRIIPLTARATRATSSSSSTAPKSPLNTGRRGKTTSSTKSVAARTERFFVTSMGPGRMSLIEKQHKRYENRSVT